MSSFSPAFILRRVLSMLAVLFVFHFSGYGQEVKALSIAAYPNPSDGLFFVKSETPLTGLETVLITERQGKVVQGYTLTVSGNSMKIDFQDQQTGEYLLHLFFKDHTEQLRFQIY